jgi:hypothetical protein
MPDAAVIPEEQPVPVKKWWILRNSRSAGLLLLSVVSTTGLLLSNLEKIDAFVRAHTPGGLVKQFPFTMEISSTNDQGIQQPPFYREEHIQEGTLIKAIRNRSFGLPALNFRIVNNSAESTLVDQLILKVNNSEPDNRPNLTWPRGVNLADGETQLTLENDGWGAALDSKIVNVVATRFPKAGGKETTAPFEVVFGKIKDKSRDVSLSPLLQEQFKIDKLPDSDSAKLSGTLSYSYVDSSGVTKPVNVPFLFGIKNRQSGPVPPAEGPGPESANVFQTALTLNPQAENYTVTSRVSANLKPKESYKFVITLCSRQSAIHEFDVILALTNGAKIKLGHYRLEFYLPRSQAHVLAQIETKPNPPLRLTSLDGYNEDIPASGGEEIPGDDKDSVVSETDEAPNPAAGPGTEDSSEIEDIQEAKTSEVEEKPKAKSYEQTQEAKEPKTTANAPEKLKIVRANYPYGIKVPGQPDVIESPFVSGKYIDVAGFPHHAVIVDPYSQQLFVVP